MDTSLQAKNKLEESEREIQTLKLTIDAIDKALDNDLFKTMKQVEAKKDAAELQTEFVTDLVEKIDTWANELEEDTPPDVNDDLIKDPLLKSQIKEAKKVYKLALKGFNDLANKIKESQTTMGKVVDDWLPEFKEIKRSMISS